MPDRPSEEAAPFGAPTEAITPGPAAEAAEFELREHFQGRRDGERINVLLPVELVCVDRNLTARTINISNSGVLLEVLGDRQNRGMAELIAYCEEIDRLFAAGGTVDFECGVTRTVEVIRVTAGGLGKRMAPLVACRFTERLTPEDFAQIGMPVPSDEDEPADTDADPSVELRIDREIKGARAKRKVPAIQELLRWAVELQATDIHIKAGSPPRLRVDGVLNAVGSERISDDEAKSMVRNFVSDEHWQKYERTGDLDVAFALEGVARFRINVLRSRGRLAMILRRIPEEVPTIEALELAPICGTLAQRKRGLVLVTGGSGSGKTTTLAAIVRSINETRPCHIITLEDPIEFVHEEVEAQITQREVGCDTEGFAHALKRVLRQDPDVIMVGEMRDLETMNLAVTAAETGHLVFATLHTTSAAQTVDRIVDIFPAEQQRQIRVQLAATLQAVISQSLVPKSGGGVTVAQEVLVVTDAVRALIRDGRSPQLQNVMQTGASDGMQTLEDSLNELVQRGAITYDTAVDFANVPGRILNVRGDDAAPAPEPGAEAETG
ncbi:MAG: PilT/PilU family type 4a pilus ATPase [Planctomycetota bacterium]|jgi:twitching motility protein PilT